MIILFICNMAPYPPQGGSPLRHWQFINILSKVNSVHVLSFGEREIELRSMPVAASWTHIGDDVEQEEFSGKLRFMKLLRPRQFPFENDFRTTEFNQKIKERIRELRPDCIILSHWRDAMPDAIRSVPSLVVDAHNIESAIGRYGSPRQLTLRERLYALRFRRRERRLLRHARMVWTTSNVDAKLAAAMAPKADIRVIPNAIDAQSYLMAWSDRHAPGAAPRQKRIGFVGRYSYPPNATAAERLISNVYPLILTRRSDVELWLVGMHPTPLMIDAPLSNHNITVTGAVDEVLPYLSKLDVLVVPISIGSGTRLKILEAFAAGVPVVSTKKGAEGLDAIDGQEIVIAESDEELAEATLMLLNDPVRASSQASLALSRLETHYAWSSVEPTIMAAMHDLKQ